MLILSKLLHTVLSPENGCRVITSTCSAKLGGSGFRPKLLKTLKSFFQLLTAGRLSLLTTFFTLYLCLISNQLFKILKTTLMGKKWSSLKNREEFCLSSRNLRRNLTSNQGNYSWNVKKKKKNPTFSQILEHTESDIKA